MLKRKTVFILGAGASKEAGLPIGDELKKIIAEKLDLRFDTIGRPMAGKGDPAIYQALQQKYRKKDFNRWRAICRSISEGIILSSSIDDFIDVHQHDRDIAVCGKLAIAQSILEAERKSKLYYNRNKIKGTIDFSSIDDTWYVRFYQLITKQVPKHNLDSLFENIEVISFNYDRCLQHFLVHALSKHYQIPFEDAQNLVRKLTILYPYGSVGSYLGLSSNGVEFGAENISSVDEVCANIKTYTEQIEQGDTLAKIHETIREADTLVFLGMAFHENNMKLLRSEPGTKAKRFYTTRKGISDSEFLIACQEVGKLKYKEESLAWAEWVNTLGAKSIPNNIFHAQTCKNLFDEYQRSLSS